MVVDYSSSLFVSLFCAASTAVVSLWRSLCSLVRRICLASARESTRSCVNVASTIEWLNNGCPHSLAVHVCQTACFTDSLLHKLPLCIPGIPDCQSAFLTDCRVAVSGGFWSSSTSLTKQIITCKLRKNYWRGPPTDPQKQKKNAGLTPIGVWTRSPPTIPSGFYSQWSNGHLWRRSGALTWTCTQALYQPGPMGWTFDPNWSGLTSCTAIRTWNTFLTVWFLAGPLGCIVLTVRSMFPNVLIKLGCEIHWTSHFTSNLKLWVEYGLFDYRCLHSLEAYPLKSKISTECTDHVFCLASSQGGELASYMLMAHSGSDLKRGVFEAFFCLKHHVLTPCSK